MPNTAQTTPVALPGSADSQHTHVHGCTYRRYMHLWGIIHQSPGKGMHASSLTEHEAECPGDDHRWLVRALKPCTAIITATCNHELMIYMPITAVIRYQRLVDDKCTLRHTIQSPRMKASKQGCICTEETLRCKGSCAIIRVSSTGA